MPYFRNFFIIHPGKKFLDQNVVEFDFSICHVLLIFSIFMNIKQ